MWCKNLVFNGIFLKLVVKMTVGCKKMNINNIYTCTCKWVLLGEHVVNTCDRYVMLFMIVCSKQCNNMNSF